MVLLCQIADPGTRTPLSPPPPPPPPIPAHLPLSLFLNFRYRRNGEDGAVADLNLASHGGSAPADDSNKRPSEVDALRVRTRTPHSAPCILQQQVASQSSVTCSKQSILHLRVSVSIHHFWGFPFFVFEWLRSFPLATFEFSAAHTTRCRQHQHARSTIFGL